MVYVKYLLSFWEDGNLCVRQKTSMWRTSINTLDTKSLTGFRGEKHHTRAAASALLVGRRLCGGSSLGEEESRGRIPPDSVCVSVSYDPAMIDYFTVINFNHKYKYTLSSSINSPNTGVILGIPPHSSFFKSPKFLPADMLHRSHQIEKPVAFHLLYAWHVPTSGLSNHQHLDW